MLLSREAWVERRTISCATKRLDASWATGTGSASINRATWAGFSEGLSGFRVETGSLGMSFDFSDFSNFDVEGFLVEGESLGRE